MFFSSKQRRRQQLLAEPFPEKWLAYLRRNVRQYALLPPAQQAALRDRLRIFIAEKEWVGCGGLTVDDEMRVTIAAQACMLLLGIEHEYYYDRIRTVLVYPDAYLHPAGRRGGGWENEEREIAGEYWHRGPVIVSWKNARDGMEDRGNLVFHEFAHHLDDIDGEMDGAPPLEGKDQTQRWERVVGDEYRRLVRSSALGEATLLNQYGATSLAEFFAVATECFFERPVALEERHPELYGVLKDFYRQDPARWPWPEDDAQLEDEAVVEESSSDVDEAGVEATVRAMRLKTHGADAYFTRGIMYAEAGDLERALKAYDEAVRLAPDDGEVYQHRAEAHLELARYDEAAEDASRAIRLDADNVDAYRIRAAADLGQESYRQAIEDCDRVLRTVANDGYAYHVRGIAKASLGDWPGALADFQRAVRYLEDPAEAYLDRADAYEELGQPDKARADREKAYRLDPSLRDEHDESREERKS